MLTFFQNLLNLSGTLKTSAVVGLVCFCLGVLCGVFFNKPTVVVNKDRQQVVRDSQDIGKSSPLPSGGGSGPTQ